jgi:fermentation-respiration switch protein FrsA (DUF1100 family)
MRFLLRLLLILALFVGASVAYMVTFEDHYIFAPSRELVYSPNAVGLDFSVQTFPSEGGVRLYGWYMPNPDARFILLALHGNGGNISQRLDQYRHWHDMGLAVFAFDYRGYGRSDGKPDEAGLYADARAAWQLLTGTFGIPPDKIIITGRSLGGAVAAHLAAEVQPAGLALEVPFTSIPDMSAERYPWLPLRWLVRSHFDTEASLKKVQAPLLLISAKADEIVPAWMPERLFDAHPEPKLRGSLAGHHNDFDRVSLHPYLKLWHIWLDSLGESQGGLQHWVWREAKRPAEG